MCATCSKDTASEFHAEAPQAIVSEGLAQSPYVAARAGFEPTTLRTKGVETTNAPPRPTIYMFVCVFCSCWDWRPLCFSWRHINHVNL